MNIMKNKRSHFFIGRLSAYCVLLAFSAFVCGAQDVSMKSLLFDMTNISSYAVLKTNTIFGMQSSYDRSGGNDDGFAGTYSVLRKENGNAVIAEIKGAGAITRIWFPCDRDYPDVPMGLRNKRIFIFLDGSSVPSINMPIVDIFNNTNKQFPYPLCSMALGGCWCYIPITFNNGAKIVVEGDKAFFFHIQYNQYPMGKKVETFDLNNNPLVSHPGIYMDALWDPGNLSFLTGNDTIVRKRSYRLHEGKNALAFLKGPAILRAFIIRASPDDLIKCLDGRIIISWDDGKEPAINVPLSMFFIQEKSGLNSKSLMGLLDGGNGVYNYFPMPYRRQAKVEIEVSQGCNIELTTIFSKPESYSTGLCYLHINHTMDHPTTPGKRHTWLDVNGEGHFAGVYMRAAGKSLMDSTNGLIYWTGCLEGDEVFEVDHKMVEHGTGTEDYFNAGWNGMHRKLDHPQVFPFHCFTLFDAGKDSSRVAAYRWHLPTEVVPFKKHFKASIEVGPMDDLKGNYESIAYYYLTLP
jgi:hypothetical protein